MEAVMPEYLAPGVYIEESDARVTPIPGVSTVDDATARALLAVIKPVMEQTQPGWTSFNDADPGITLLQLFAWIAESLLYRSTTDPELRRRAALAAASNLVAVASTCAMDRETLKRPHFFDGQLIDAATLQSEQAYYREKHRRHNRHLHGFGIVSGLTISIQANADRDTDRIVVEPGCAIDGYGEEITVAEPIRLALAVAGDAAYVSLRHWDHPCASVPLDGAPSVVCTEEVCVMSVVGDISPPNVTIARLVCADGHWVVDAAFTPPRARPA
jgi:hypothetical protein